MRCGPRRVVLPLRHRPQTDFRSLPSQELRPDLGCPYRLRNLCERSSRARNHSATAARRNRMTRPITTRGGPHLSECQRAKLRRLTPSSRANSMGLMYSPAMIGAAKFAVLVSLRSSCLLVFIMNVRLPLSSTSVYVPVLEKSNRGQFSGKKLSVYAGTRADANFVRISLRGQFEGAERGISSQR